MDSAKSYDYDVALSFAGEDRMHAEALAEILRHHNVKIFYDNYEKSSLWGKNLYTYLSEIYQEKARYCVMFLSQYYAAKLWTNHERESAQARAFRENEEYILPVRLDNTKIPGIPSTIAYLSWPPETAETVADAIMEKLEKVSHMQSFSEKAIMDELITEAQALNGKVSVDLGDIHGVKHSMRMAKDNEDWEAWYGQWFHDEFTTRM